MAQRVVLAYSGGLDTSVAVRWMIENMGVEVVCLSADVGQEGTLEGNREKALGAGAIAYEQLDLREEFARDFLAPIIKANALYEDQYPLVSALSRPLIVKHQVAARPQVRRRRGCPRLHRQGQRPGSLRGLGHGARARPRAGRTGAQLGLHPRGLASSTQRSTRSPLVPPRRSSTPSTTTCSAGRSNAARWRTPGPSHRLVCGR
ncbi:MAG: argininosuccinate synthase domain-containing protein [Microthrixaceae bacterium]